VPGGAPIYDDLSNVVDRISGPTGENVYFSVDGLCEGEGWFVLSREREIAKPHAGYEWVWRYISIGDVVEVSGVCPDFCDR